MAHAEQIAFLGIGANLGARMRALTGAIRALQRHPDISVERVSPVYESAAHTLQPGDHQPPYLNAVLQVRTALPPEALLVYGHVLERRAGRQPAARWSARPLDVDLLLYGTETRQHAWLTLPHPRMAERRFVLQPLADLAPERYVPPPFDTTVADLLHRCPDPDELSRVPVSMLIPVTERSDG